MISNRAEKSAKGKAIRSVKFSTNIIDQLLSIPHISMAPSRQQPAANARQDRSPRTRNGRAVKPTERQQYSTDEAASKQLRRQTRNSEGNQALNNAVKTKGKRSSRLRPTTDDNGRVAELEKQLAEVIGASLLFLLFEAADPNDCLAAKGDAVLRSQELQKACDLLKKQVESNKNASMTEGPDGLSGTIPKPKGRAGLQAKMGLSHKRSLYKDIIVCSATFWAPEHAYPSDSKSTIHECTWAAQIDHSMTWKDLDPLVKGQICTAVCYNIPIFGIHAQAS